MRPYHLFAPDGRVLATVDVQPENVNMTRVNRTLHAIDELPTRTVSSLDDLAALNDRFDEAAAARTSPTWLFVVACITGACSLGLIFGVDGPIAHLCPGAHRRPWRHSPSEAKNLTDQHADSLKLPLSGSSRFGAS